MGFYYTKWNGVLQRTLVLRHFLITKVLQNDPRNIKKFTSNCLISYIPLTTSSINFEMIMIIHITKAVNSRSFNLSYILLSLDFLKFSSNTCAACIVY